VISSLLPVSSIITLYFVPNVVARLGIVVAFTAAFSICLTLVTQARRVDIFSANVSVSPGRTHNMVRKAILMHKYGFAAVLVVFLTGYGGNVT
jgi:hypothetical protein